MATTARGGGEREPAAGSGGGGGAAAEMEVEAYRRLFPVAYFERHLRESVRLDARPLASPRDTSVALGLVGSADGSALVKFGDTTMVAAIKLEVMTPPAESSDEGSVAVDFYMPPICSPTVRPGRSAEVAPVISKQLSDVIMSSGMINLKDLCLINGKASWIAYLDIYCLNADGSLFDAALVSAVAAFTHCIDDGRVVTVPGELEGKTKLPLVNKDKRKLMLNNVPFSLTCGLHKEHILVDPTAEEESIIETFVTVVLDTLGRVVSVYKPGGSVLAYTSILKECITLAKRRAQQLRNILNESVSAMEVDKSS
ncbi:Exosome complex component RRP43 [Ananas comosus]|uniref:Ribosomal RNA-processing protein 43 n=1 Tax=Ananas comosus TaxID=4615 RepID=A0A199UUP6_ANACO|nr:Exosome complex component RRP43 [Ananas comosus]